MTCRGVVGYLNEHHRAWQSRLYIKIKIIYAFRSKFSVSKRQSKCGMPAIKMRPMYKDRMGNQIATAATTAISRTVVARDAAQKGHRRGAAPLAPFALFADSAAAELL